MNSHAVLPGQRRNRNDARDASRSPEISGDFQLRSNCKNPQQLREILMHRAPVHVRSATLADQPAIVEFNLQLAAETEDKSLDRERLSRGVSALLGDATKGSYFVTEIDGRPAGQIMYTREWSDWRNGTIWWLQSVFVRAEWRGQGVLRQLFEHFAELAQNDPTVVGLRLYVDERNSSARQVYGRLGLDPAGYEVLERMWIS